MIYILTDLGERSNIRTIGAYRIATALRKAGYDAEVIDFLSEWSLDEILSYIDAGPKPLWIGISTTFSSYDKKSWNEAAERSGTGWANELTRFKDQDRTFFNELKKRAPVIAGGSRADRVKYFYEFDFVLGGYADDAVVALSDFLSNKIDHLNFVEESIKSEVVEYTCKKIDCQKYYVVNDVTDIGTEFVDNDFIEPGEGLPLEISRGCIFKCAFCAFPLNGKSKNDYIRPKEEILKDVKRYQEKHQSTRYMVLDDTFNDNISKLTTMKDVYESSSPFEFWAYCRLDVLGSKPEMIDLIPKIGWKWLTCGVETFNKSAGSIIGKGAGQQRQEDTLKKIKELYPDVFINLEFIVGLPKETKEDSWNNFKWLWDNPLLWDEVNFKKLSIDNPKYYPWQSKFSASPETYGIQIIPSDSFYRLWNQEHMGIHEAQKIVEEIEAENRKRQISGNYPSSSSKRTKAIRSAYWEMAGLTPKSLHEYYSGDTMFALKVRNRTAGYRYKSKKLKLRNLEVSFDNVAEMFKTEYKFPWHTKIFEILKKTNYNILPEDAD